MTGTILSDGGVIGDDGISYILPIRKINNDGYPMVLIDAKKAGGGGTFGSQSIKPLIGMKVSFVARGNGFNYEII